MIRVLLILALLAQLGCSKDILVLAPDSPALVVKASGWVDIAVYDPETKTLVHYGKVKTENYVGWTLHKYEWNRVLRGGPLVPGTWAGPPN